MPEHAGTDVVAAVELADYACMLGVSPPALVRGRAADLCDGARSWYAAHGRPRTAGRLACRFALIGDVVVVDGARFTAPALAARLTRAEAIGIVVGVASAGGEVDVEVERRWRAGEPDAAFFLSAFAAAVCERLVHVLRGDAQREVSARGWYVLPPESPGCAGWGTADLPALLRLAAAGATGADASGVSASAGESLRPVRSQVVAFPLAVRRPTVPESRCRQCDHPACARRRDDRVEA